MLLGSSFEFNVQLSSPMLISLTRCYWMIEALGMLQAIKIQQPSVSHCSLSIHVIIIIIIMIKVKVKVWTLATVPLT